MNKTVSGLEPRLVPLSSMQRIITIFAETGAQYMVRGAVSHIELVPLHDVHAFWRLSQDEGRYVLHVQGYPGLSDYEEMQVSARIRDWERMLEIRAQGGVSIGNEHAANLESELQEKTATGVRIPFSAADLKTLLRSHGESYLGRR
tara:strand:- start:103 stop:540 length:438 start_codon:yes stop_codon:yes gene_type:complete